MQSSKKLFFVQKIIPVFYLFFFVFPLLAKADSLQTAREQVAAKPPSIICDADFVSKSTQVLLNRKINIHKRENYLQLLVEQCSREQLMPVFLKIAMEPHHLEWFFQQQLIYWIQEHSNGCNRDVLLFLWQSIQKEEEIDYVRESMIWTLANTRVARPPAPPPERQQSPPAAENSSQIKDNNIPCDSQAIYWFSNFIQEDRKILGMKKTDFRSRMILPLFLSIARLGIRNQNPTSARELKAIALNHAINDYFRSVAVEALQMMGVYLPVGSHTLYEVIRDISKRYIGKPYMQMKDDELVLDKRDEQVRSYAYQALDRIFVTPSPELMKFVFDDPEELNSYRLYFRRAFRDIPIPNNKAAIQKALKAVSEDSIVSPVYRKQATRHLRSKGTDNSIHKGENSIPAPPD